MSRINEASMRLLLRPGTADATLLLASDGVLRALLTATTAENDICGGMQQHCTFVTSTITLSEVCIVQQGMLMPQQALHILILTSGAAQL